MNSLNSFANMADRWKKWEQPRYRSERLFTCMNLQIHMCFYDQRVSYWVQGTGLLKIWKYLSGESWRDDCYVFKSFSPSSTSMTNLPSLSRSLPLLAMEIVHTRRPSVQGMVRHPITTVLFPGRYWCDGCPGSDLCEGENNKKAEANR